MRLNEFAPTRGGGAGDDYLRVLASAWYNDTFNTGSLQKGIKSQEDVERLLQRGIVCNDGKKRKYNIGYNGNFDGVVIYSDDYYEYGDESGKLDSRTGKPWGPYEYIEYHDSQLDETKLNEFAPNDGGEGGKFIPWNRFVDQLKEILHKDFDCKESINMDVIKARFVPYDPMEYGPTVIYSRFERRAGNKGAHSVHGQIQVGKFYKGSRPGENKFMTAYQLLKGTPFERYFELTPENVYRIAQIIKGNTEGRLQTQHDVSEGEVVPFRRPQQNQQPLSWNQLPKDVLALANDWYWAEFESGSLDSVMDPRGLGGGYKNELQYTGAKLQQRGWKIDIDDEYENVVLTNKQGQSVLLPISDAQDFTGWAKGTNAGFR